jgi:predicted branched-subunit amino acid permease
MGFVKAGGWIAIGLSLALVARVLLINNPEAIIVVAPAVIGGIAVVSWPRRRWVLIAALVLVGATATYSLVGGIGLLYIPSLVLIVRGALRPRRTVHSQP